MIVRWQTGERSNHRKYATMLFLLLLINQSISDAFRIDEEKFNFKSTQSKSTEVVGSSLVNKILDTLRVWNDILPAMFQCLGAVGGCYVCPFFVTRCETSCLVNVCMLCLRMIATSARSTLLVWGFDKLDWYLCVILWWFVRRSKNSDMI